MTETGSGDNQLEASVADEVRVIVDAFAARGKGEGKNGGTTIEYVVADDGGLDYMYAKGQLLVREQYLSRVLAILEQPEEADLRERPADPAGHRGRGPAHPQ